MFHKSLSRVLFLALNFTFAFSIAAQVPDSGAPSKKNARPSDNESSVPAKKSTELPSQTVIAELPSVYFYEFTQPEFVFSKILIEHDENGVGALIFQKKNFSEEITEPLKLSAAELGKVKAIWQRLNFLDSIEDYQFERDYSHLGNKKFTMKKEGRERTAVFNWTANPDAKELADEYRRIGNQLIWVFEVNVARENQPLESARIMDSLDMQLQRNEIADPEQLLPFLKELGDDERMPLISRNHAARIAKDIGKRVEQQKKDEIPKP